MATVGHIDCTYLHVVQPVLVLGLLTKSKDVLLADMVERTTTRSKDQVACIGALVGRC
jgi:hypothetical protein